jgi:uncharacterized membrane protein YgcG
VAAARADALVNRQLDHKRRLILVMKLTTVRRTLVPIAVAAVGLVALPAPPVHADNQNCGLIPVTNCQYDREEHHHEGGNSSGQQQQQQGSGGGSGGGGSSSSSSSGSSGSSGGK